VSVTNTSLPEPEARLALQCWLLPGAVDAIEPGSGTANASVIVRAGAHTLLLKRRNPRYAKDAWVRFDHALMAHLAAGGIPVPVALPARDGNRWAATDDAVYELYPFMLGDEHAWGDFAQVHAAGEMLGRFHLASADFDAPADKRWPRYHSPTDIASGLASLQSEPLRATAAQTDALSLAASVAEGLRTRIPDDRYWSLPRTIVHGDWHPGNLKFAGNAVAGVFDLDWCTSQPRMIDLADGLLFFCSHRAEPIVPGDIWSLTQSFRMDADLVVAFGEGYRTHIMPTPAELAALPDLMRSRWLYCRIDAAARKIDRERRLKFIARDLATPLDWIDANADRIADGTALGLHVSDA